MEDFSTEHLDDIWSYEPEIRDMAPTIDFETRTDEIANYVLGPDNILNLTIKMLNRCRDLYLKTKEKTYWWQIIQLLPSSYNQTRNVMMNYEVLANIYKSRKNHKLDEWRDICKWIEELPYSELITAGIQKGLKTDLVNVTRCKNCKHYISKEDMKNNEMYKDYHDLLGYDGLCMNTNKWTDENEFCSSGKKKED